MRHLRLPLAALVLAAAWSCASGPKVTPGTLAPGVSVTGKWDSNWGRMELRQSGAEVTGTFEGNRAVGTLTGTIEGDILWFDWVQPGNLSDGRRRSEGKGWFRIAGDGRALEGAWGYQEAREGGGKWTAEPAGPQY
jgi:hypothetical protein